MKTKFALLVSLAALNTAHAGIIFTTEAAGVQQTTVSSTITETFDLLPTGSLGAYNSLIGNYSGGAVISDPNEWGGAGQSRYVAVGAQSGTTSYSLSFASDLNYFGLSWQAGDAKNELRFFNDGNLVQSFSTNTVFASLSNSYKGNPNTGQNMGEKYAFFNFVATNGTVFDQVMFYNNGTSTGFETDNHTILRLVDPQIPTLEAETPEPATIALVGAAMLALVLKRRRK